MLSMMKKITPALHPNQNNSEEFKKAQSYSLRLLAIRLRTEKEIKNKLEDKSFSKAVAVSQGDDWYAKILLYADMRVMPHGIVTLEERLSDVRSRMPQYTQRPDFEDLLSAARNIENQLIKSLNKLLDEIDWGNVAETEKEFNTLIP